MVNVNMSYAVEQINTRCNLLALSRSRFLNMTPKQAEDHFERIINDRRPVSISVIRPTNEQVVLYQGLVNYCKDKLTVEEAQAQAAEDRAAQEILKAEAQAEAQAGAQAGAEAQMTPAQTAAAAAEEAVEAEADRQKREDAADKQHREVALLADANEKFEHFIEMIYSIEAASQQRRNNQEAFTYTNNIISGSDSLSPRTTNGTHVFKLLPPSYEDDSLYSDSEYYIKKLLGKTLRSSEIELDQIGISVDSVYYSYSPNYPKGIVSWQSPAPLDSVRKGFGVRLEVSTGLAPNDFVTVPDLQGIFYSEAIKKIDEIGLKEGSVQFVNQDKFLPNTVLNQNPKEGTKVSQDSPINLIISK